MTTPFDSDNSSEAPTDRTQLSAWLKVSAVAAASALAGGLAAAWFYRNTLKRLRHAEGEPADSNFGISGPPPDDEA